MNSTAIAALQFAVTFGLIFIHLGLLQATLTKLVEAKYKFIEENPHEPYPGVSNWQIARVHWFMLYEQHFVVTILFLLNILVLIS